MRWKPPVPPKVYPFPAIVNALAFTPDGKQLVVGGHHELTVWDIDTGKLLKRIYTRAERAYGMVFLPDGKLAVAGGRPGQEGDVRIYDINAQGQDRRRRRNPRRRQRQEGAGEAPLRRRGLGAVHRASRRTARRSRPAVATAACASSTSPSGLEKAKLTQTVENHADWVLGCALTADGKYLVTAGRDKTAKVWDLKAKESVVTFPEHQNIVYARRDEGRRQRGFLGRCGQATADLEAQRRGEAGEELSAATATRSSRSWPSPKEPMLATSSADKTVRLWNAEDARAGEDALGADDYVYARRLQRRRQTRRRRAATMAESRVWKVSDGSVVKGWNASPGYVKKK